MSQSGRIIVGGSAGPFVATITGNNAVPVSPSGLGNFNLIGLGGVTVTSVGAPANTLNISMAGGGLTWYTVPGTTQAMNSNSGYITQNVALTTFTLPALPTAGDIVRIAGYGAGGWTISLSGGQAISYLTQSIITSISSQIISDSIELVYSGTADLWITLSSMGTLQTP